MIEFLASREVKGIECCVFDYKSSLFKVWRINVNPIAASNVHYKASLVKE